MARFQFLSTVFINPDIYRFRTIVSASKTKSNRLLNIAENMGFILNVKKNLRSLLEQHKNVLIKVFVLNFWIFLILIFIDLKNLQFFLRLPWELP